MNVKFNVMMLGAVLCGCQTNGVEPLVDASSTSATSAKPSPIDRVEFSRWHDTMKATKRPKAGCFRATFPNATWEEVPCHVAPNRPTSPGDYMATSASTDIEEAIGYFWQVEGASSVSSQGGTCESDNNNSNAFSLQLNTNTTIQTLFCNTRGSSCHGWVQFVVDSLGDLSTEQSIINYFSDIPNYGIYMQYWLTGYGSPCPPGWNAYGDNDCWVNSTEASIQRITPSELPDLEVIGVAGSGSSGPTQEIILSSRDGTAICGDSSGPAEGEMCSITSDAAFSLIGSWNQAEFNIFGEGCGAQAVFDPGTTLGVELNLLTSDSSPHISWTSASTTAETNNLPLGTGADGACATSYGIKFEESNGQGTPVCCPVCAPGTCGTDGCGGQCTCGAGQECDANDRCEVPSCPGGCTEGKTCQAGVCACPSGTHIGERCVQNPVTHKPVCQPWCVAA